MRCCIQSDRGTPPDEATPKDSFYCLNFLTQRPAHIKSANSGLGKVAWRLFLGLLSLPSIV
jgi:hypothetical protein